MDNLIGFMESQLELNLQLVEGMAGLSRRLRSLEKQMAKKEAENLRLALKLVDLEKMVKLLTEAGGSMAVELVVLESKIDQARKAAEAYYDDVLNITANLGVDLATAELQLGRLMLKVADHLQDK